MTREEAISKAINIVSYFEAHFAKSKEAREDAANIIEALEQEPCVDVPDNNVGEMDCISRQAVAEVLLKYAHSTEGKAFAEFLVSQINALPPVTPAEKVGQWIYEKRKRLINETDEGAEYVTDYWCKCSKCGGDFGYRKMKDAFCKYCGAKMQEVKND